MKRLRPRSLSANARISASVLASAALLGGLTSACGETQNKSDSEAACSEASSYLEKTAWPTVLGTNCADCHTPGGPAPAEGSDFVLLPPGYPNFQQRNLENLAEVAAYKVNGTSILLLKPQGKLGHGGGQRVKKGSDEYRALESLVERLDSTNNCEGERSLPSTDEVDLLSANATFRKAALHLAYRLPTDEEITRLADEGEQALPEMLEGLMKEEPFYARLKDIFNDQLLVERYMAYTGFAINVLNEEMYPESAEPWDAIEDEDLRRSINRAVAQEPLDYIAYLVKHDKPFTDVVAGDYMVVNPLSAPYFNAVVDFKDPSDVSEFVEAPRRVRAEIERDDYQWWYMPAAGVLTSPMFMARFPTTDTNRNRHRARMILDIFLGTDILKVGDRPLDPTQAGLYPNPTLNDPSCASCHEIIDPIAGAFQEFSDNDQTRYQPYRSWYGEMRAAGFGDEQMATDEIGRAPSWLGQRIARDPRFPFAMVKIVYEGLMGRAPIEYPEDYNADDYGLRFASWSHQEHTFQAIGKKFADSGFNLRTVFRELILSAYYRADGLAGEPEEWKELDEVGTARLSTPMLLARKIEAVTGIPWRRGWDRSDNLMTDYRILYGGIDSDTITKRLSSPNGVMASVAWRMANEMACTLSGWEFYLPASERKLLSQVSLEDAPQNEAGQTDSAAVDRIKTQIRSLYMRIIGEEASEQEVERAYELFLSTWTEGQQLMLTDDNGVGDSLSYNCRGRINQITGEEIPDEEQLRKDPRYVARSWMAVLTYLLSDYKFLYE